MVRRITPAQFRSQIRQLENKAKRDLNNLQREVDKFNREIKKLAK